MREITSDKDRYLILTEQYCRDIEKRDELLILIRDDLKMKSDIHGVVDISNFIWERLNNLIEEEMQ